MRKPMKPDVAKVNVARYTLSAHGSILLNRKLGGKFPYLTICAEAWILDYRVRIFFLDLLMWLLFRERNHCQNQYLKYGRSYSNEADQRKSRWNFH